MRYLVLGAGAVGGALGGRLAEAGHEVLLVARGAHAAALRATGLQLRTPEGTRAVSAAVAEAPEEVELRPDDVVLLTTKTQHTAGLLDTWAGAPVRGGGTLADRVPVVCAQNGVENERIALRRVERVYAAMVWLPATHLQPGLVEALAEPCTGHLELGCYPDGSDDLSEAVATDLTGSRVLTHVRPDVMRWKYGKLLRNLRNGLEALCLPEEPWDDLLEEVRAEAVAALAAAGLRATSVQEEDEHRGATVTPARGSVGGSSTWQSLARGSGSVEVDYLNGEVVLLGRLHGVPTPVNAAVQATAREAAARGRPPRTLSPDELRRRAAGRA